MMTLRVSRSHPEDRHPYGFIVRGATVLALVGMARVMLAAAALTGGWTAALAGRQGST